MNHQKYRYYHPIDLLDRTWPSKRIEKAPIWCSVDLRDGNQALEIPMNLEQKLVFFKFLTQIGFKEIEVGFPAASDTEFEFVRTLIENNLIPEDVTIQVLTQSRPHIIEKTFEAVRGARAAVIHLYNSTSTLQREVVFRKDKGEIKTIAVEGAKLVMRLAEQYGRERFTFEYSPESFSGTEPDYAAEVCNAVLDIMEPTTERKVIINLPNTVEMTTPNVFADMVEYVVRRIHCRENVIISMHTHNDRGTAVAATELGLLAGADRVEGTVFGNGERTGNADIMNLAMNLYMQGIDPELDFSEMDECIRVYENSTSMKVPPRHPFAGSLVYTAFSGSHQDAINKGMTALPEKNGMWEVPYLPIDPKDVGRNYDPIIRINSQSGKGGVAYILETHYGMGVPKVMQQDFGYTVTRVSDMNNAELTPQDLYELFKKEYINIEEPLCLLSYNETTNGESKVISRLSFENEEKTVKGSGDGIVDAFSRSVSELLGISFEIVDYRQHSLDYGMKSRAITYVTVTDSTGQTYFGAGLSVNISKSSLKAIVSAVNNIVKK